MSHESQHIEIPGTDATLPRTLPPGSHGPVGRWTLDTLDELAGLRADLTQLLHSEDGGDTGFAQTRERVVLVASELATNALRHGRPPTDVTLLLDGTWLLDVADGAHESPPVFAGRREPGVGGMGLHLTRRLALDVGWYTTHDHKHVWVTFPLN